MDEDGTHVARRVASLEQASPVITAMLIDAFGVANPRPFQVDGIYALAYLSANLLVVQKTGAGKSLVPLGAAALMGGVTYIIEPLVTVGDDQASSANRQASAAGVKAFHLDGLHGESKAKLIKFLLSMTSRDDGPVLLYASPQSMGPGYPWHDVLVHLLEKGLVTLLGIDEVHKALRDGLEFRPDFRKLKTTFWSLASLSPVPIAKLSMTATLPLDSRALYLEMMGLPHFSHVIHGDVSRLDVLMYATVSATSTQLAKALCEEHLLVPKRKVIVFTSNASAAEASLTDAFKRVIEAAPLITGDVVSLTGRTANIRKAHIMNALASDQRSPALDLRVAVMTAAGECGFNAPRCGLVIELGLPENIDGAWTWGRRGATRPRSFRSARCSPTRATTRARKMPSARPSKRLRFLPPPPPPLEAAGLQPGQRRWRRPRTSSSRGCSRTAATWRARSSTTATPSGSTPPTPSRETIAWRDSARWDDIKHED